VNKPTCRANRHPQPIAEQPVGAWLFSTLRHILAYEPCGRPATHTSYDDNKPLCDEHAEELRAGLRSPNSIGNILAGGRPRTEEEIVLMVRPIVIEWIVVTDPIEKATLPPEFRVEIRVRNNRLIRARERLGYKSAKAAADALNLTYGILVSYETMAETPLKKDSMEWKESALRIADALFMAPEDLWPKASRRVEKARVEFEATSEQLREFSSNAERRIILEQDREGVRRALSAIDPRRRKALLQRFENDAALEEVGDKLGVSRARASQIILNGIRDVGVRLAKDEVLPLPLSKQTKSLNQAQCCVCGSSQNLVSQTDRRRVRVRLSRSLPRAGNARTGKSK